MSAPEASVKNLTFAVLGGSALIFGILYAVSWLTQVDASKVLPSFTWLSLLWLAACIGWFLIGSRHSGAKPEAAKEQERK